MDFGHFCIIFRSLENIAKEDLKLISCCDLSGLFHWIFLKCLKLIQERPKSVKVEEVP